MKKCENFDNIKKMCDDLGALQKILHEAMIMLEAIDEYGEIENKVIAELCKNSNDIRTNIVYLMREAQKK